MKGFKSFADSTTLVFEPGVTVIVGPNGSGKSNVVDAVVWALGAQAPSAVRSAKMDDVIFSGTAARAALGRAEVSLSIDNSARLLPIDFEEVAITRTLFRDGDSTYAINGVPSRLLDVQELLSDAGVGRQQHVIVSQRQIDGVLSARPEDRRAVIEEAAGVLKYRRRKEKSERRLEATQANLARLSDVIREIRKQLRPLERQAEAARRHGSLLAELSVLQRYLAGREIHKLRDLVSSLQQAHSSNRQRVQKLNATLEALEQDLVVAQRKLAGLGGSSVADELVRVEALVARLRGTQALAGERRLRLQKERNAEMDADVVATLEAESDRLAAELARAEQEAAALPNQVVDGGLPNIKLIEHSSLADKQGTLASLLKRRVDLMSQLDACWSEAKALQATQDAKQAAIESQTRQIDQAQTVVDEARAALAAEVGHLQAWQARQEALSLALAKARDQAGVERLADVQGLVGTLLEVIDIDEGYQAAFEAAVGEAAAAVVATDTDAAIRAIATLQKDDVSGAVLALGIEGAASQELQAGVPLRSHVRSNIAGMDMLLDVLVGAVGVVETAQEGIEAVLNNPDAVLVTRQGDRFSSPCWRVGKRWSGATQGMLLQAQEHVVKASQTVEELQADLQTAIHHHQSQQAQLVQARNVFVGVVNDVETAAARCGDIERKLRSVEMQIAAEETRLHTELQVHTAGLAERCRLLAAQRAEIEQRLAQMIPERTQAAARRQMAETKLAVLEVLNSLVARHSEVANLCLQELRLKRNEESRAAKEAASKLEDMRQQRSQLEAELARSRSQEHSQELELAEAELKLEAAVERCRAELGCEPQEAIATQCPELVLGISATERIAALNQELKIMGPVNPLALEEFEALSERHSFTQAQIDDIRQSRRELHKVINKIDQEIVSVFSAAYADVSRNFAELFQTLFPNGEGKLILTRPDALLETGVEVEARPSDKNVRRLSLLSGGERSLAALAFLFAVFRSRPSPFYVMDEVEAALDDVNLHRFLNLVDTFRADAQLLLVTHQKRTMEAADCLYGVSMKPGGSSKVLSEKLVVSSTPEVLLQPSLQQV